LLQDRYWDRLLRYCADNGSYQGCPLPPPEEEFGYSGYSDTRDQSASGWEYNQEPSDGGFRHDNAPSSTEKVLAWSERPDEEYQSAPSAGSDPQEETPQQQQQHVEEEAGQDATQPGQHSTNDDEAVDGAYVQKYNFPPGWCDVSSIPATGWD
jgi:helicase MOV-10